MSFVKAIIFIISFWSAVSHGDNASAEQIPFSIPNTEKIVLPVSANGIAYELYVHVPPACSHSSQCPVVYMLDAEYSFALASTIITHLTDRNRIPPVISVAIGYPDKSHYRRDRTRDYTPFFHQTGGYGEEMQKVSGGGPAFLEVIKAEVIPFIEESFPAATTNRTLVGHSYGGLFASYAWMTAPDIFDNYIIISPSLWYADGAPLAAVRKACEDESVSESNIYLAVGAYEEQPQNGRAMVSDLEALEEILSNCESRKVSTYMRVFEDETHASIFPAAFSTGLRKLFQR
ncbi:alpha/beta hydrolase-fold protein [Hyphococcus flavus]|uniref:Alpha/beta hydrolase-fold protein n=1 Tax=Hyphococcus flavus TaxID=1866326 RepID=A0AAF0CH69_9PROT|nr:alpha/beta hydrolase-fold protein [Hyphococcus flavus]WDI33103.1 alpha/beta hydrolase-fold protein [Hyphococcus flavus]